MREGQGGKPGEQLGGDATLNLETKWLDLRAAWEMELIVHGYCQI